MHAAPSVSYPVERSAWAGALVLGLVLAGLAAASTWILQSDAVSWRHALALAVVCMAAGVAGFAWLRSPAGLLHWSGEHWLWEEGAAPLAGRAALALDLQARMLLRWQGDGGTVRWLWVERASDPSHWDALRRAVYSRASAPIPPLPQEGPEHPPPRQPPAAEQ